MPVLIPPQGVGDNNNEVKLRLQSINAIETRRQLTWHMKAVLLTLRIVHFLEYYKES